MKYEELIQEICSDDDNMDNNMEIEKSNSKPAAIKKQRIKLIGYNSSENLNEEEKIGKLKILSKIVRRYRRKLKNLKRKFKTNTEKSFKKYMGEKLNLNRKDKRSFPNLNLNNIMTAVKKLRSYEGMSFSNEKHLVEQLVDLIATKKINFGSIQFKKIATQIRLFLEKSKVNHISRSQPKIFINLPEKDVYITKKRAYFLQESRGRRG